MQKISLAIIFRNDIATIRKCLESVNDYVDEIIAVNTGSIDGTDEVVKSFEKAKVFEFTAVTNPEAFFEDGEIKRFDLARNYSFEKCTGQWILWLDCDDTLRNPEQLRELVTRANEANNTGWSFRYIYQWDRETGDVMEEHWKTQLVQNNGAFEWLGWVHEDLLPKYSQNVFKTKDCTRLHWREAKQGIENQKRNLRILLAKTEQEGESPDPRTMFYLGRELVAVNEYDKAIPVLEEFIGRSGWDEERWQAYQLLGLIHKDRKDYDKAISMFLLSLKERPDFPDSYFHLALVYQKLDNHERALWWIENGMTKAVPKTNVPIYPQMYTWKPLALAAYSNLMLGRFDNAKIAIIKARAVNKKSEYLKELEKTILEAQRRWKTAESYLIVARFLRENGQPENIQALLASTPRELYDDQLICRIRNEATPPRKWGEKSVTFMCHGEVEVWSPLSLTTRGIGGSEEATIYLTRELAKLGWVVTVYNWCENESGVYNGVTYRNWWEFNPWDKFNILVGWRMPGWLDVKWNAQQVYLDMHDVCSPYDFPEKRLQNVTKILVKSQYHRSLFPTVPNEKFAIIGNGISSGDFVPRGTRNHHRVIYTSAPNRGIDILLELWPKVLDAIPDAILTPYYGWKTFDEIERNNPNSRRFSEKLKKKMADLGIEYPRINQQQMLKEMFNAGIWAYPTYFPEIDCITAKKMQAAGVIPICTNYAALKENVHYGVKIDGDIYRADKKEEFLAALIDMLKYPEKQDTIRTTMMNDAQSRFSWEKVAQQWDKLFTDNKPLEA